MTTNEILKAAAAKLTTDQLLDACDVLDAQTTTTNDERMVRAAMADVIEERHSLTDAMNEVYTDLDFAGSYTDALRIALTKVSA